MAMMKLSHVGWVTTAVTLSGTLAGMELWSSSMEGGIGSRGVLTGVALTLAVLALTVGLTRSSTPLSASIYATLRAAVELLLGAGLLFGLVTIAVLALPFPISFRLFHGNSATDWIVFALVGLGLLVALRSWHRYSEQKSRAMRSELKAAEALTAVAQHERELALSQLMLLRAQVEPHFLWNTLAHLQFLIQKSPGEANHMIAHLIRYLRAAVPQMRGDSTTLGSEFDSAAAYLELMKIRMGARLTLLIEIPPALRNIPFAPLLIQTLVENAIKHGVEPKVGPVSVSLKARTDENAVDGVVVEVIDNGVGLQESPPTRGTGFGLRSVRERIRLLYGAGASLQVAQAHGGGVIARMVVPMTHNGIA
ncbi:sensor histidine kinase [Paraburkholderia sp. RL17-337-BIB-A]|uniref:sensor histidine kinase n=1 Tax=Paraburkholderia sp. RL17-337-BIB-A TaxID=3031636 RepID=UPI0038BBD7B7